MNDKNQEESITAATTEEMEEALSGPAHFVNKFYVSVNLSGIRLTFAESSLAAPKPKFRTAVFLGFDDFLPFINVLNSVKEKLDLKKIEVAQRDNDAE